MEKEKNTPKQHKKLNTFNLLLELPFARKHNVDRPILGSDLVFSKPPNYSNDENE